MVRLKGSFLRYLLVGSGTSLLDLSLFSLLSVVLLVPVVPANIVSTIVTLSVSYLINQTFVFKAGHPTIAGFLSFAGLTLFSGLVLQSFIVWSIVEMASLLPMDLPYSTVGPVAKTVAMGIGAMFNYLAYKWVFSRSASPKAGD